MKKEITILSIFCALFSAQAQNPTTSIATWKNDAQGAYSFIHDDYGDYAVRGINDYADTIARNRGIKFTFGAITKSCEENPQMWTDAIDMLNYGHEIINHSHNHTCAVRRDDWCTSGLWAEPSTENFDTEMTYSSSLIKSKTGTQARYFIYPFDLYNESANNHLKTLDYIGARTGQYEGTENGNFAPDADGFFRTALIVNAVSQGSETIATKLNYWADYAATNKVWVNREMHNVGSTGWGRIGVTDYRDHLNHLKTKMDANELWVGTISEVLTYQVQKLNYTPNTAYNISQNKITITWNNPSFDVAGYLAPLAKKSPVTLMVNLDGVNPTGLKVNQGGKTISGVTIDNGVMKFDAYPSEGTIIIEDNTCTDFCLVSDIKGASVNKGQSATFTVDITSTPTVTYKWYFNNVLINGASGNSLTLNDLQTNQSGTYKVVASKAGKTDIVSTSTLTVSSQTPFNGIIATIPGKIEFENFDIGGEGVSFHDSSPTNEGGSDYRSESVDVELKTWGQYKVGYCTEGEWLEYTVNVEEHAIYDLVVSNASEWAGGAFKLSIDGVDVSPELTFTPTFNWNTFQESAFSNITLEKGQHILRVTITANDTDFDWMEFKVNKVITGVETLAGNVNIFPNPSDDQFTISAKSSALSTLKVINVNGQIVSNFSNDLSASQLTFGQDLQPGVYIVEFEIEGVVYREKLVKN